MRLTRLRLFATMLSSAASLSAASPPVLPGSGDNVVWDSPSKDAHGSMPLGNGDIGINAWVEATGDLVFYISKMDAWDENGRLCKVGRVRVTFDPPLAVGEGFRQELKLREGAIEIAGGGSLLRLWVDANAPVVRLEARTSSPVKSRAAVELWRLRERPFAEDDDSHCSAGLVQAATKWNFTPTVLPDVVVPSSQPVITWYHRNTKSIYDLGLRVQHLESLQGRFPDPLLKRTYGALLRGADCVPAGSQAIASSKPGTQHEFAVVVHAAVTDTPEKWLAGLQKAEKAYAGIPAAKARRAHEDWWRTFWARSWVVIDGAPEAGILNRGYRLQRFMNACAGRGGLPIKFNGSMFTVEKEPGAPPEISKGDPDWRQWGGNYWFQNTRLAYWPMLEAGDFDLMDAWFNMYLAALPLSEARMRIYYGFTNAAQFPETMYWWGLPNNGDYGWNNRAPEPANAYISRYWSGGLELLAVMLDRYDFTQDRKFAQKTLVPLAGPIVSFFGQYWPKRDAQGKIIFDPAQSLETWHSAVNPLPEIAGLRFILPRLLALPETVTSAGQRAEWRKLLDELPPVPIAEVDGTRLLRPAMKYDRLSNSENPELYAVFPYRLYGVGKPDLELARATYNRRANRHNRGWCQDSIQAAWLGLGDEAARLVTARAAQVNPDHRFPAMWGPNFDWIPDQDHGNNILTTLQSMLLQYEGDRLFVLPAWPKKWDVAFKLHGPNRRTVEVTVKQGKVVNFQTRGPGRPEIVMGDPQ